MKLYLEIDFQVPEENLLYSLRLMNSIHVACEVCKCSFAVCIYPFHTLLMQ